MIQEIFPSFYITGFDDTFHTYKKELIAAIDRLRQDNEGVDKSNRGGWQSENYHPKFHPQFFKDEFASRVVKFIETTANEQLNDMFSCSISGLWININPIGSWNEPHIHPGSRLSGAFYVKVPEESGDFIFINNNEANRPLSPFLKNISINEEIHVKPYEGQVILFDSYMNHRVGENKSKSDRISIAFNLDINVDLSKIT